MCEGNYIGSNPSVKELFPVIELTPLEICMYGVMIFSIVTSVINVIVFSGDQLKDFTYKYLLVSSVCDIMYLSFGIFSLMFPKYCCESPFLCGGVNVQHFAIWSYRIFQDYLTSSIAIYNILSEVFLSLQRLLMLMSIEYLTNLTVYQVGPVMAIVALVYYLPVWSLSHIVNYSIVYANQSYDAVALNKTDFAYSQLGQLVRPILSSIRIILVMFLFSVLNIFTIILLRRMIVNKEDTTLRVISKLFHFP